MHNFREAAGNGAGGWAEAGQELFADPRSVNMPSQLWHPVLANQIISFIQTQQPFFSRSLILEYATALAAAPLVLLAGADPQAAAALARAFAHAVVGANSPQLAIVSDGGWHHATGEDEHYRTVQQRFRALRCQEIAQEATENCNAGKAFFVCFESLQTRELAEHMQSFHGDPQTALSAVVPAAEIAVAIHQFPAAAVVNVRAPWLDSAPCICPPPVGVQRLWLQARLAAHEQSRRGPSESLWSADHRWLVRTQWRETLLARSLWFAHPRRAA